MYRQTRCKIILFKIFLDLAQWALRKANCSTVAIGRVIQTEAIDFSSPQTSASIFSAYLQIITDLLKPQTKFSSITTIPSGRPQNVSDRSSAVHITLYIVLEGYRCAFALHRTETAVVHDT